MYINTELPTKSYRVIDEDGKKLLLIVGYDHKTGKKSQDIDEFGELEKIAKKMYPDCSIKYRWCTEDCISLDKIPYIGEFSRYMTNVYIATGFKKWGITTSCVAANIIKDMILGKKNKYEYLYKATRMEPIKNVKEVENMIKEVTKALIIEKFKVSNENISSINREDAKIIEIDGKKVGIYKDKDGELYGINPVCSHLGCELQYNKEEKTWDCPCHGSRFDINGNSLYSPSVKDLDKIELDFI